MPVTASGSNSQPVSSNVSRLTASAKLSACSRWPAGLFSTVRPRMTSSTTRKRLSRPAMAATVTCGFQTMLDPQPAEFRVRLCRLPDAREFLEPQARLGRRMGIRVPLITRRDGSVQQARVVRQEVTLRPFRVVAAGAADLDVGAEALGQGHEAMAGTDRRAG